MASVWFVVNLQLVLLIQHYIKYMHKIHLFSMMSLPVSITAGKMFACARSSTGCFCNLYCVGLCACRYPCPFTHCFAVVLWVSILFVILFSPVHKMSKFISPATVQFPMSFLSITIRCAANFIAGFRCFYCH